MDIIRQNPDTYGDTSKGSRKVWHDLPILFLALIPMVIIVPVLPSDPSSRPVILISHTSLYHRHIWYEGQPPEVFTLMHTGFDCHRDILGICLAGGIISLSARRVFSSPLPGSSGRIPVSGTGNLWRRIMDILSGNRPADDRGDHAWDKSAPLRDGQAERQCMIRSPSQFLCKSDT